MLKQNYIYVIVLILLVVNSTTIFLLFLATDRNVSVETTPYKYLNPFVNMITKENLVINLRPLREELIAYEDTILDFDVSLYIESLNSGANVSINPDLRFDPASLTKVPVVMLAFKKIENNDWHINQLFTITENDLSSTWGTLYKKGAGTTLTLKELIVLSLEESDNTAHNVIYHNLTPEDVLEFTESLGLYELFDSAGNVSVKEYSKIFRALYLSSFLEAPNSEFILTSLANTKYNNYLGSSVPKDVAFSHKFGEKSLAGIHADSGIMYIKDKPMLITLMVRSKNQTSDASYDNALQIFKTISEIAVRYFSG